MTEPLLVRLPDSRIPEHIWIVKAILTTYLGLDVSFTHHAYPTILISDGTSDRVLELPSVLLTGNPSGWDRATALPDRIPHWIDPALLPWSMPEPDVPIPVLYTSANPHAFDVSERRILLPWDLFGSAFFMLSRLEEVLLDDVDAHGRFPAAASLAVKAGFERTPVVNAWGELLWEAPHSLFSRLSRKQRDYKVVVSHDVDWPLVSNMLPLSLVLRAAVGDLLVRKAPLVATKRILSHFAPTSLKSRINPGNTFDFIMSESERYGIHSAFYFIPENTAGQIDGTYSLNMPFIQQLFRQISARGHEIGVHPGYETFRSSSTIATGFSALRTAAAKAGVKQTGWGGRQHYLRWSATETWRHWEAAGLTYDSTVGYAETVGFRTGACFDYPVFDVVERRELALIERPLIVMEGTLFKTTSRTNLALSDDAGLTVIKQLVDSTHAYNGNFTLLWHNSSLITLREKKLYRRVLASIHSNCK